MATKIERIIQQADKLIKQEKYSDARKLLIAYKDNPAARKRLKRLKDKQVPATKQGRNKRFFLYGMILLVLSAFICAAVIFVGSMGKNDVLPTEVVMAEEPIENQQVLATEVPTETLTATFTDTSVPSETASPTDTHTATLTATNTSTRTPLPTATDIPPASPTPTASETPIPAAIPSGTIYYTTDGDVRVRECPFADNDSCPVVAVLARGQQIEVLTSVTGSAYRGTTTWYEANINGHIAYIHSALVSENPPVQQVPNANSGGNAISASNTPLPSTNNSCSVCATATALTTIQPTSSNPTFTNTPIPQPSGGGDLDGDGLPDAWEAKYFGCFYGANPSQVLLPNGYFINPSNFYAPLGTASFPSACRNYNAGTGTYDIYLGQNSADDPDGDGCNNGCEYITGGIPFDVG